MAIHSKSVSSKVFDFFNYCFMIIVAVVCILPFINILAISFSGKEAAAANAVTFWPVGFHTDAYEMVMKNGIFLNSFLISTKRVLAGVLINMILIVLTAYPLSLDSKRFKGRNFFMWYVLFTMLFSGGLIPLFITVNKLHLINNFWALILPGAVPVFSVIIMMNFFKGLPPSISESAMMDGAGHWTILFKMFIPLSLPSMATLALLSIVGHWNDWFTGLIFMTRNEKWPLQTFLYTQLVTVDFTSLTGDEARRMSTISNRTLKAAQIFIAMIPILVVYPFLQKYFVTGLTIGSVKE